jgi:hypothetical protein
MQKNGTDIVTLQAATLSALADMKKKEADMGRINFKCKRRRRILRVGEISNAEEGGRYCG